MGKKIVKDGWVYDYEETAESQIINGYEVTGVRYVLGELFDTSCNKALICIGINPSTATVSYTHLVLRVRYKQITNQKTILI